MTKDQENQERLEREEREEKAYALYITGIVGFNGGLALFLALCIIADIQKVEIFVSIVESFGAAKLAFALGIISCLASCLFMRKKL